MDRRTSLPHAHTHDNNNQQVQLIGFPHRRFQNIADNFNRQRFGVWEPDHMQNTTLDKVAMATRLKLYCVYGRPCCYDGFGQLNNSGDLAVS